MRSSLIALTLGMAALLPGSAGAAVLYENPPLFSDDALASCMFNVPCAAAFDLPPSYGGQSFTLANDAIVRSASFTELDLGSLPSVIQWAVYDDDAGGAPGTLLVSGVAALRDYEPVGTQGVYQRNKIYFDLPNVALNAGSYVFALQVTAPTIWNFLVEGQGTSGAWQKFGSEPWGPRYGGSAAAMSVAVGLYDTSTPGVPEPATWALLIAGFALVGGRLRSRATAKA